MHRGPQSAQVIDRLIQLRDGGTDCVFLCGNHESMFRRFVDDGDLRIGAVWLANGGTETLESYGIDPPFGLPREDDLHACLSALRKQVPQAHLDFLRRLDPCCRIGGYFFVHAGVRPGVPLDRQDPDEMMWIRGPFLSSDMDFGALVVHGHTPDRTPDVRPNRIGLDTGAGKGGYLTAGLFWSTERTFLHADPHGLD